MIDVDWSSLMPKQKQETRAPGAALLRFTPGAMLLRAGVSRRLAGPQLLARVKDVCAKELEDAKGEETTPMHHGKGIWMIRCLKQLISGRISKEVDFCLSPLKLCFNVGLVPSVIC